MSGLTRRELLLRAMPLGVAGFALARLARGAESCVLPESESMRASLNYASTAADPAVACARCAFFTADTAGGGCGACQILGGPVDATGHCDSFSPPS
jgi:hypothetical protein